MVRGREGRRDGGRDGGKKEKIDRRKRLRFVLKYYSLSFVYNYYHLKIVD